MELAPYEESELLPVVPNGSMLEKSGWNRYLTPQNQPIPKPDYLPADWQPNYKALTAPTPKDYIWLAKNDRTGAVMYRYVPVSWMVKVANRTWGPGNWACELIKEDWSETKPNGNKDYTVVVQLVAPMLFRPIIGVGSSTYYTNNPQESEAKTRNAAYTAAFKSCMKQLGVGRDVELDDPDVAKTIGNREQTITLLFSRLVEGGHGTAARNVIKRYAPSALTDDGVLLVTSIDFEQLEPVQRELQQLVIKHATQNADASSNGAAS